jgi:hypothetical protein
MSTYPGTGVPRDNHTRGEADTYYGLIPSSALDASIFDLRAASIISQRILKSKLSKRGPTTHSSPSGPIYAFSTKLPPQFKDDSDDWGTRSARRSKRCRIEAKRLTDFEIHQSTCLNLDAEPGASESELWILPDFEEWEMDAGTGEQWAQREGEGEWAPLIKRAVDSNRDRLKRRLEGDGWDFVGGKFGEEGKAGEESMSEGSVDEEFDVVVLEMC